MKKIMMAGALTGFSLGIFSGLVTEGSAWPGILLRASVAAFTGGLLFRWWGRIWTNCLKQVHAERVAAWQKQQAEAAASTAGKPNRI